jgi:hypothetical protein
MDPIVVYRAAGMVSKQLAVNMPEALFQLEARAVADERDLVDVAKAVLARRIRFAR